MRWLLPLLLASALTLGLSVSSLGRAPDTGWSTARDGAAPSPLRGSFGTHRVTKEPRNARGSLRTFCGRPETLRLRRFEDRSVQLLCGGRVLVRVAVPG